MEGNVSNTQKFNPYKQTIISSIVNLLIVVVLVKIFRNEYSEDSLWLDVFYCYLFIFGIQMLIGIKNIFVTYIVSKFVSKDASEEVFESFKKFKFPTPHDMFDIDEPEIYLSDIVSNESVNTDARIYSTTLLTELNVCRRSGRLFNLYIGNKMLKKSISRYRKYCLTNSSNT